MAYQRRQPTTPGLLPWFWAILGIGLAVVLVLFLVGVFSGAQTDGFDAGVSAADITGDPGRFVGQEVALEGPVQEVFGPRLFMLDDGIAAGTDLLVLHAAEEPDFGVEEGEWVRVEGVVHTFSPAELEAQIGRAIPPAQQSDLQWDAVVVASLVEVQ